MANNFRFEFKYNVSDSVARRVEVDLKKNEMKVDKHASKKDGSYTVTSLYFDSFKKTDYFEKANGELKRKKIRLRIYEPYIKDSDKVFFEIKHKIDMVNKKTKLELTREEFDMFMKDGVSFLLKNKKKLKNEEARNKIAFFLIKEPVKPTAIVSYKRKAFLNETKDLRITLDYDIVANIQKDFSKPKLKTEVNKNFTVIEVKYSRVLPYWFKSVIKKYNLERDTFSKYENSLEEIYKYNPLLR